MTEKLQDGQGGGRQSYWGPSGIPARSQLLSFFDDGEETAPRPSARAPRPPQRPSPRRPQGGGGSLPLDQHTLMVRRRVAAGVGVVLLIVIILLVNGCLKGQKTQALKDYNHDVSQLAQESDERVSRPLFTALSGRRRQVRPERRGADQRAAHPGPDPRLAGQEAERARRHVRRAAQPAAGIRPARGRAHEGGRPHPHRARRPGQSRPPHRSPATWRSSWPPMSSTPSAWCR